MPKIFPEELKAKAVARMLEPGAPSVMVIAREFGISDQTLNKWKKEAIAERAKATGNAAAHSVAPAGVDARVALLERRVAELEAALAKKNAQLAELALGVLKRDGLLKD